MVLASSVQWVEMPVNSLRDLLVQGADKLSLQLTSTQIEQLLNYLEILSKWNCVYNLTAISDPKEMVVAHLLDSLSIMPYLKQLELQPWIDVGSGAGLPGIPLAIACPDVEITLIDSNAKKTRFLTQVIMDLMLSNVQVINQNVLQFHPKALFGLILSRAFSSVSNMLQVTKHLICDGGCFVAMKGRDPHGELANLPWGVELEGVFQLDVPGLSADRHLVILKNQGIVTI